MNDMFTFDRPDWELLLDSLQPGCSVNAVRLLAALETEDESAVEEAFDCMMQKGLTLDVSQLPASYGSGELENRLRMEERLAKEENMIPALETSDPLRLYLEELAGNPAQGDTNILLEQYLQGDNAAAQKLVDLHLSLAVDIAKTYVGSGVLLLDLIQEAGLGLWQGILQYTSGDFQKHVRWWIRQSIAKIVLLQARQDDTLRGIRQEMEAYRQADQQLLISLGRNATVEEIAVEMGVATEQALVIQDMLQNAAAMEKNHAPKEAQPEDEMAVEDTAYFQSRQRVAEMLSQLTETEAQVLFLRFGLDGKGPASPEAVGVKLGMKPDAVVAMEAAALAKLRKE